MARNVLAATSLTLLSLLAALPAQAAQYGTVINQPGPSVYTESRPIYLPAPPPPRHEAVPHSRRGQVWVEGHWEWQGRRHVWMPGYWVQARPGQQYRPPRWEQRDGRWEMQGGRWDSDGDGVPNRYDRSPHNPNRR
ncbi:MAG: YXWGXW repeat-containing protein [Burkholderiaceae bacterium]|jgi:hypothetical protein|nr:YXWGXW repeat-containing protein [Burkholderiaceae bacterium]